MERGIDQNFQYRTTGRDAFESVSMATSIARVCTPYSIVLVDVVEKLEKSRNEKLVLNHVTWEFRKDVELDDLRILHTKNKVS